MTNIYLVRHCEAKGNIDRIFHGRTDSDISERGKEQLKHLAERFKAIQLDCVYSSPLLRTQKTAEAVNKYHQLPIIINEDIIEIDGGCIEGLPWKSLPELYPHEAKCWNLEPHNFDPENGESMLRVYERIWTAVSDIVRENKDKNIAIASHGCAIRNLLCRLLGYEFERLVEVEWCDNTGVALLRFNYKLECDVEYINDISHLPAEFSTFSHQNWWKKESIENLAFD